MAFPIAQRWLLAALILAGVASAVSGSIDPYFLDVVLGVGVSVVLASSLNLINGFTGQFSLGHAGFMAVGAYTSAMLTTVVAPRLGWNPVLLQWVFFPMSLIAAGLLAAVGQRAINLPVDLTNFVMLDIGQPMHAFDASHVKGRSIRVRFAKPSEHITTLDEQKRVLEPTDLLVCAGDEPEALAGIMGGEGSKVTDDTSHLVLEVAAFHAPTVRRTSARLGLRTDASARFEKTLDPELVPLAAAHLVRLLQLGHCGRVHEFGDEDSCHVRRPPHLAARRRFVAGSVDAGPLRPTRTGGSARTRDGPATRRLSDGRWRCAACTRAACRQPGPA